MNIIDAFHQLGSYRAAARLCGTTDKTVERAVGRQQAAGPWVRRPRPTAKNTNAVMSVIRERVRGTEVVFRFRDVTARGLRPDTSRPRATAWGNRTFRPGSLAFRQLGAGLSKGVPESCAEVWGLQVQGHRELDQGCDTAFRELMDEAGAGLRGSGHRDSIRQPSMPRDPAHGLADVGIGMHILTVLQV